MSTIERLEALTLEDLAELDSSILVDVGAEARVERDRWIAVDRKLSGELIRRMHASEATMAVGVSADAALVETRSYQWDVPKLAAKARPLMTAALWDQMVEVIPPKPPQPTYKVNTRGLLGLAKKLGRDGNVIHECYSIELATPRVTFERKEAE